MVIVVNPLEMYKEMFFFLYSTVYDNYILSDNEKLHFATYKLEIKIDLLLSITYLLFSNDSLPLISTI